MANRKKPIDIKVFAVFGTVHKSTKDALDRFFPISGKKNMSQLIGSIVESWVEANRDVIPEAQVVKDERQMELEV